MREVLSVLIVMALTALSELALHYFPWRMMLGGKDLRAPWNYVVGVLAMLGPFSLLLVFWALFPPGKAPMVWALVGLIAAVVSSGGAVIGAYWLDAFLLALRRVDELQEQAETLKGMAYKDE